MHTAAPSVSARAIASWVALAVITPPPATITGKLAAASRSAAASSAPVSPAPWAIRSGGGRVRVDAHAVTAGGARVAIGHVDRTLLMRNRHEADTGGGKDIERIHERRADDSEHMAHAVAGEGLDERFGGSHFLRLGHRLGSAC